MPYCPIFAVTRNPKTYRQLALVNNVVPLLVEESGLSAKEVIAKGIEIAKEKGIVNAGDVLAIAGGEKILEGYDNSDMNRTLGGVIRV